MTAGKIQFPTHLSLASTSFLAADTSTGGVIGTAFDSQETTRTCSSESVAAIESLYLAVVIWGDRVSARQVFWFLVNVRLMKCSLFCQMDGERSMEPTHRPQSHGIPPDICKAFLYVQHLFVRGRESQVLAPFRTSFRALARYSKLTTSCSRLAKSIRKSENGPLMISFRGGRRGGLARCAGCAS